MNVYIVYGKYEIHYLCGVFSTRERATQYINDMLNHIKRTVDPKALDTDYWIDEVRVDALVGTLA